MDEVNVTTNTVEGKEKIVLDELKNYLDELARQAKDISLIRHVYDFESEYVKAFGFEKSALSPGIPDKFEFSDSLKDISRSLKIVSGGADIYLGLGKIGTNEWFKGVLGATTGVFKIASAFETPGADMIYGYTTFASAFNDMLTFTEETTEEKRWSTYFKATSGASRSLAGICKVIPGAQALSIPLGLMSGTFSVAARFFEGGKWFEGIATLVMGTFATTVLCIALKAVLVPAFNALMGAIAAAFGSLSASVSAAVAAIIPLWPVWTPIVAFIAYEIIQMIASKAENSFARGGFPIANQPFIAREDGSELVGILRTAQGQRTAVVNNDQIVEAVSIGVFNAFRDAFKDNPRRKAVARVFLDGKEIAMAEQA